MAVLDESADELFGLVRDLDRGIYLEMVVLARRVVTAHKSPRDLLTDGPQVVSFARDRRRGQA